LRGDATNALPLLELGSKLRKNVSAEKHSVIVYPQLSQETAMPTRSITVCGHYLYMVEPAHTWLTLKCIFHR